MISEINAGISALGGLLNSVSGSNETNTLNSDNSFESLLNKLSLSSTSDDSDNKKTSEMDLNQDGTVTIDEVLKYIEMQSQNQVADNSNEMMSSEKEVAGQSFTDKLKVGFKQAVAAYSLFS